MSELKGDYQCYGCGYTEHNPEKDECQNYRCDLHEIKTVEQAQENELSALRAENAKLREALKAVEYTIVDDTMVAVCPKCESLPTEPHEPDCIIGNALKGG